MNGMKRTWVCVDTSVVINFLIGGPFAVQAKSRMYLWEQEGFTLIAPVIFDFELVSTIRRMVHLKHITLSEGEDAFSEYQNRRVHLINRPEIVDLAWQLSKQFSHSRIYDASYLAVAQLEQCEFYTADKRLYNSVQPTVSWVHWLGHEPLSTAN